ncbi:MAG: FeoA family protein [Desulfurococcaceae archaeon TW002]
MTESIFQLSEVPEGCRVRIRRVCAGRCLSVRLYQMGIVPGEEVLVKHNNRGFIILEVKGVEISLSKSIASKVEVECLPDSL